MDAFTHRWINVYKQLFSIYVRTHAYLSFCSSAHILVCDVKINMTDLGILSESTSGTLCLYRKSLIYTVQ